jgi:hypothetical protein
MGTASLYPTDVRTVYVPMFESDSFRRNLGERLTEAVMKEIELKTPFKVVNTPNADSVLTGKLLTDNKYVLIESKSDEPRMLDIVTRAEVTWADRRGEIIREGVIALDPTTADIGANAKLVPEVGQSMATAQTKAIGRLAEQIVGLMEAPW